MIFFDTKTGQER